MKKLILLLIFLIVSIVTSCQTFSDVGKFELPEIPQRPILPTSTPLSYSDLYESFVLLSVYSLSLENWAKEVSLLVATEKPPVLGRDNKK